MILSSVAFPVVHRESSGRWLKILLITVTVSNALHQVAKWYGGTIGNHCPVVVVLVVDGVIVCGRAAMDSKS